MNKPIPLTRQGVRNLNVIGPRPRKSERGSGPWLCPPHLPGNWKREDGLGVTLLVRRCRSCGATVDFDWEKW